MCCALGGGLGPSFIDRPVRCLSWRLSPAAARGAMDRRSRPIYEDRNGAPGVGAVGRISGSDVARAIDLWRCAIVKRPIETLCQADLVAENLVWLPPPGRFQFHADPFGIWRDDMLYVFAETMSHLSRKGYIDVFIFDRHLHYRGAATVLKTAWHLSYPSVFQTNGEIWMLPEARQSGRLTLYRAHAFPEDWRPVCDISLDAPAVDATPLFHDGGWWLFYGHVEPGRSELRIAFADRLTGPWRPHPLNPVIIGAGHSRPGGTPILRTGAIELPVQDCTVSYGGALRKLLISRLDQKEFEATDSDWLSPPRDFRPFCQGLHTTSAAGPYTLIDLKRVDGSWPARAGRSLGNWRRRRRLAERTS
jgi:hypothetical protein